jgi:hypothetical protein
MIQGYSGCTIEFTNGKVIKSSTNYPAQRLEQQAKKQQKFANKNYSNIHVPHILSQYYDGATFYFEMEYFNAIDMIQFLNTKNIDYIKWFFKVISTFIDNNLIVSTNTPLNRSVILDKYDSVKIDNRFDATFYTLPQEIILPIGPCHGDLTLSNILYGQNKFVLIDWLDSFIETPLIDIAKLRQDTRFYWSLLLYQQPYNKCRIMFALKYFDNKILKCFNNPLLHIFEILNLLRILPYCKTDTMKSQIEKMLCQF